MYRLEPSGVYYARFRGSGKQIRRGGRPPIRGWGGGWLKREPRFPTADLLPLKRGIGLEITSAAGEHRIKVGFGQYSSDLRTLVALNLNLAVFHRATGAAGALHRLG